MLQENLPEKRNGETRRLTIQNVFLLKLMALKLY